MFDLPHGLDRTRRIRYSLESDSVRSKDTGKSERTAQQFGMIHSSIDQCPLFFMDDAEVVRMFGNAFEPELNRLKNASPTVESSPVKATGSFGDFNLSPSQLLYQADYTEVNRTLVGMLALKWIVSNDYESFASYQAPPVQLQLGSFQELRGLVQEAIKTAGDAYALMVSMLVNDLGKDPGLRGDISPIIKQHNYPTHLNHDMIVYIAGIHGVLPLINEFEGTPLLMDLRLGLQFGSELNIAQLAQAEDVPGSMEKAIAMMTGHRHALELKFLELLLDVAGAAGHSDARCAKAMVEPVFRTYMTTRQALLMILDGKLSLEDGYNYILDERGQMLQKLGFQSLSAKVPSQRALLRLLTMSRTATRPQAELIACGFRNLDGPIRQALTDGLSVTGLKDGTAILPYYMPALFAETLKATETASETIKVVAMSCLMRFLARVYHGTKPMPGMTGNVIEYDVSFAKNIIQSHEFVADPEVLDLIDLPYSELNKPMDVAMI